MTAMRTPGPAAAATSRPRPRAAAGAGRALGAALRRFARDTRAAAGIATALLIIGFLGAGALIVDHLWLYDQRDVLKTAAEAASSAATLELGKELSKNPNASKEELKTALEPVAKRYILVNLSHLPSERLTEAENTLKISFEGSDWAQGTVKVTATANLGGTLFSRYLPLLGNYEGPDRIQVEAGFESDSKPAEVVLAIDISHSMKSNLAGDKDPPAGSKTDPARIDIVKDAALNLVKIINPDADNRVAVGVVPWHIQVRLESDTADYWVRGGRGWAVYPTQRFYEVPYVNCDRRNANACTNLPDGELQQLPDRASFFEGWKGCLTEARTGSGTAAELPKTAADRFAPPSQNPFAQGYFSSGFGNAYKCLDPRSADFPTGVKYQACYQIPSGMDAAQLRESSSYLDGQGRRFPTVFPNNSRQRDCTYGTATILPLSTNPKEIEQAIQALVPAGQLTYSALGVLWGQRLLTPSWKSALRGGGAHPLDPDEVRKAIVLLTDGQDTYCGGKKHGCDDSPVGISRAEACDEAKSRGTEIFVIAAMNPDYIKKPFSDALRACSSEDDDESKHGTRRPRGNYVFLNNTDPEDLKDAFKDIASQLRTLRRIP